MLTPWVSCQSVGRRSGAGHGGHLPPPLSGIYDVLLPWPPPLLLYYLYAHTRALELDLLRCRANRKQRFPGSDSSLYNMHYQVVPWLHDGAYIAQRLLAQSCSLISSSRDRGYACCV